MNVAIMIPELGGGGAERIAVILGNMLIDNGYSVYYFVGEEYQETAYECMGTIITERIHAIEFDNCFEAYYHLCSEAKRVRKLKRKYSIDISISFMEEFNYLNVLSRGKDKVITRICTILSERQGEGIYFEKYFASRLLSKSDRIVVMSEYAKNDLVENYSIDKSKIMIIFNPAMIHHACSTEEWNYGTEVVVSVGRLEIIKQPDKIIRAFAHVVKQCPKAHLIMIGQGLLLDYLKELCKKLCISTNVTLIGFQENVDFYLENAKVFVMASKTEGFPNGMIEAMAHGLPIVSMDSPGAIGEILGKRRSEHINAYTDELYGVLTPYSKERMQFNDDISYEENELAIAISKMLMDNRYRKKYEDATYNRATQYSYLEFRNRWISLIGEVVCGK